MNQEKIGKFIAELRKGKNMTQSELASKMGITDRAISKWENGRGMPDLSLIKDLCKELDISINELLSGEKIEKREYQNKFEENILNTISYSNRKIMSERKKIAIILGVIGLIITFFVLLFIIDINCIKNNKPVFFSTWGYDYVPPIDLSQEQMELSIFEYLINQDNIKYDGEKRFVSTKTYLVEEKENKKLYNVYSWVLVESYYLNNEQITLNEASSMPYLFVIKRESDKYSVLDVKKPRDGSLYNIDMKTIFPTSVRENMDKIHKDGTIEKLEIEIEKQVNMYFHE